MTNNKHAFWQALLFTMVIFGIGLLLGFFLENSRGGDFEAKVLSSEINFFDEQIRNRGINDFNISCDVSINDTFDFADRIYVDALKLEDYDSSAQFTTTLREVHKRYDLLRMLLWDEAMGLNNKCENKIHTVVYFYNYKITDPSIDALQDSMGNLLLDIKNEHSDQVLLIPIAANLDLGSVDLVKKKYGLTKFPSFIVDENIVIDHLITKQELENVIFESSKR